MLATLRTSFSPSSRRRRIAFKIDPALVPEITPPRPWREIFVHTNTLIGVHLRGGPIARGGLRWSDRLDDVRVEVLGLMRTQQLKNGLIVPVGAKGGFVLKPGGLSPNGRASSPTSSIASSSARSSISPTFRHRPVTY